VTRELAGRIDELQRRMDALAAENTALRGLADDAARLERLAEQADRLSRVAARAVSTVEGLAKAAGVGAERTFARLNTVYHADVPGYLCAYFAGGYNDVVELLVGPEDPPTQRVCRANSMNDINSYAGALVRAGEYWMVTSELNRGRSGFTCVFTPLY
jgi:hypothetical protein